MDLNKFKFARSAFLHFSRPCGLALLLLIVPATVWAQSTDRDNPTVLTSNEIKDEGPGKAVEYYYSITAGPGEVILTVDLKAKSYSTAARFELLDAESNQLVAHNMNASTTTGAERAVEKVRVREKQQVVLKLVLDSNAGEYMIRFAGAVEAAPQPTPTETTPSTESSIQTTEPGTTAAESQTASEGDAATTGQAEAAQSGVNQKAKEKAKTAAKKAANKALDKLPF